MTAPPDELTAQVKMLVEHSMRAMAVTISRQAIELANDPSSESLTGKEALTAFASAILATNERKWGKETPQ